MPTYGTALAMLESAAFAHSSNLVLHIWQADFGIWQVRSKQERHDYATKAHLTDLS